MHPEQLSPWPSVLALAAVLADACAKVAAFGPSLLIVSLGLDTYVTDPISDLAVTTDFRDVLSEAVSAHLGNRAFDAVFPGYAADARRFRGFPKPKKCATRAS